MDRLDIFVKIFAWGLYLWRFNKEHLAMEIPHSDAFCGTQQLLNIDCNCHPFYFKITKYFVINLCSTIFVMDIGKYSRAEAT